MPPPSLPSSVRLPGSHRQPAMVRSANDPSMESMAQKQIVYTDDATTKLGSYIRRRCYNCHTPDSAAWRRSGMHPGKVVSPFNTPALAIFIPRQLCNKCGLYERTHQKDRPHDPAELRSKPRKTLHQKLAGPGVPSSPVDALSRPRHSPGGISPVLQSPIDRDRDREMERPVRMEAVPPRPLNTHASLLHMHAQNQSQTVGNFTGDDQARQSEYQYAQKDATGAGNLRPGAAHPHSLGSLLNHAPAQQHSRSHSPVSAASAGSSHQRDSPRGNSKQLHLSPVMPHSGSGYPIHPRPSASSPHSIIDVDREYPYEDKGSPHSSAREPLDRKRGN